jgi:hypothetical protein
MVAISVVPAWWTATLAWAAKPSARHTWQSLRM